MLPTLLDRLWTPTALYALAATALLHAALPAHARVAYALLAAATAWYGRVLVRAVGHERTVDGRGGRAPVKRTWTPFNLYTLGEAVYYFSRHRNQWVSSRLSPPPPQCLCVGR